MTDTLTLYTNPMSRGRIARWMLEEVGATYETVLLDYATTMKAPAYLAINPMGKVPAITHGDRVVTETPAICAYLADAFPDAGLAPAPADRAAYYRWLFFAAGPFEAATTDKALGAEVGDKEGFVGYGTLDRMLNTLEAQLDGRDYIVGDRFTAADVYVGAHLSWAMQFGTIAERPAFRRYADRMAARPAALRAGGLDDAAMPKEG